MTADLYADLSWLPEPPADCRAQIKAMRDGATGEAIMRLATHALSDTQLTKLSETIGLLSASGADLSPLTPFRLGIIGTGTLDLLLPALIGTAARHGIRLECVQPEYGQIAQEALDPGSRINRAKCDAVLIAVDYRSLPIPGAIRDRTGCVEACISFLDMLRDGFRRNGGAPSIVQTFAPPPEALFGSLDFRVAGTLRSILAEVNRQLVDRLEGTTDLILDVAGLAETAGLAAWYSPEQWNLAKLPFSATYLRLYADHVGRLLGAIRGTSRRCLILDLDNTLWGGVIGDDGLDGIRIGQGDATGEAYLAVQRTALSLRERGVVLAVSSKNTDETARVPFRNHPEMLLRENHFAVFQANWNDKATNIKAIAEELSLGLSSWCSWTTTRPNAGWSAGCCRRSLCPNCPTTRRCMPGPVAAGLFRGSNLLRRRPRTRRLLPGQRQAGGAAKTGRRRRCLSGVVEHGRSPSCRSTQRDRAASLSSSTNPTSST